MTFGAHTRVYDPAKDAEFTVPDARRHPDVWVLLRDPHGREHVVNRRERGMLDVLLAWGWTEERGASR